MNCKICGSLLNNQAECPKCGFQETQNYERYPTFVQISQLPSISTRRNRWEAINHSSCPICRKTDITLLGDANSVYCSSCDRLLPFSEIVGQKGQEDDSLIEKPIVKTKSQIVGFIAVVIGISLLLAAVLIIPAMRSSKAEDKYFLVCMKYNISEDPLEGSTEYAFSYSYDASGNLIKVTGENDTLDVVSKDNGRVLEYYFEDGNLSRVEKYDNRYLVEEAIYLPATSGTYRCIQTQYGYDEAGRENRRVQTNYNQSGDIVFVSRNIYDGFRLIGCVYSHYENGELTDTNSDSISTAYDEFGRLIRREEGEFVSSYTYDAFGNLIIEERTIPNVYSYTITYEYVPQSQITAGGGYTSAVN